MRPTGPAVPGNRWDLVDTTDHEPAHVSVVVTHYEQPTQLARTLHALTRQTHPADLLEVIVADDGSPVPPTVPAGVRLVTQRHDGFGAARARNLGARAARGDVLVFLDADTSPEPGFVSAIARLPAVLPEAVVVGRRRHADLMGAVGPGAGDVRDEVEVVGPDHELPGPRWLIEAHRRSRHLLDADETSFRHVISAVLACSSWLFEVTGGFDETFTRYGGEDWEWAHRAWTHGALLAHEPAAVAWHDGPDHGHRDDADDADDARRRLLDETLAIARRVPVAGVAPSAFVVPGVADPLVTVAADLADDALVICLDSLLAALPRSMVLVSAAQAARLPPDPRVVVQRGDHLTGVGSRSAWRHLHVARPVAGSPEAWTSPGLLLSGPGAPGRVDLTTTEGRVLLRWSTLRAERRSVRWDDGSLDRVASIPAGGLSTLRPGVTVQAHWGGWS